jgi:hypothetical protein
MRRPDLNASIEVLVRAVLVMLLAERQVAAGSATVADLAKRQNAVALAARDLTNDIDDSPPSARPKGWALDGDESG